MFLFSQSNFYCELKKMIVKNAFFIINSNYAFKNLIFLNKKMEM
ncbi:hypothetical protein RV01_GL001749 [Enterococcus dispar]|nr:hypothetical protein RV01_GL001749 [Enterococcus dispar]